MKRVVAYRINLTELYERTQERKLNYALNTPISEIKDPELRDAARELGSVIQDWIDITREDTERIRRDTARYKSS